jgi:hypothetical protein
MMISLVLFLICLSLTNGSHFNGGSITWSPVNPYNNDSLVMITITQTYFWTYPTVDCSINVPITTPAYNSSASNLNCVSNCSTSGNYTYKKINILTDCISSSLSLGVMTSQRSVNITFPLGTYFWISYKGASWRGLKNFVNNSDPMWDITSLIDLQMRPDGFINTPPVAYVASPQYVIVNVTTTIVIPVSDVNTNDDLRCRWSSPNRYNINKISQFYCVVFFVNSSYNANECGDICTANSILPSGTILSNCTITFMSTIPGAWYGFALQVNSFQSIFTFTLNRLKISSIQQVQIQ